MAHKIEIATSGRALCRGCKQAIAKGEARFCEEAANPYSEDGGTSFRYWHLACAARPLANELGVALVGYEGRLEDRETLDALVENHRRPATPYAERAVNGRARCRGCDVNIAKGDLRVAFERVFEGPMGPQKGQAYVHARCVAHYLARERERGREAMELADFLSKLEAHSELAGEDRATLARELAAAP